MLLFPLAFASIFAPEFAFEVVFTCTIVSVFAFVFLFAFAFAFRFAFVFNCIFRFAFGFAFDNTLPLHFTFAVGVSFADANSSNWLFYSSLFCSLVSFHFLAISTSSLFRTKAHIAAQRHFCLHLVITLKSSQEKYLFQKAKAVCLVKN